MSFSVFYCAKNPQKPTEKLAMQANRIAIKATVSRFGCRQNQGGAVFQVTVKVRESRKNFEGSTIWFSPNLLQFTSPFILLGQEASFLGFLI